jgi:hypothetical protein
MTMQKPGFYLTARQIGTIQDAIVARAKTDGAPDREIAAAAGVSDTVVPHWRMTKPDGLRHMRIVDLLGLMREYGAVKVLGPLAAARQHQFRFLETELLRSLLRLLHRLRRYRCRHRGARPRRWPRPHRD